MGGDYCQSLGAHGLQCLSFARQSRNRLIRYSVWHLKSSRTSPSLPYNSIGRRSPSFLKPHLTRHLTYPPDALNPDHSLHHRPCGGPRRLLPTDEVYPLHLPLRRRSHRSTDVDPRILSRCRPVPLDRHPPRPTQYQLPCPSQIPLGLTVKLDSRETPPPLHFSPAVSDRDRSSTRETTPIATPRGFNAGASRKVDRDRDNLFNWHHKNAGYSANTGGSFVDDALLEPDLDDPVSLIDDNPKSTGMGSHATPINIHSPQYTSTSHVTDGELQAGSAMSIGGQPRAMSNVFGNGDFSGAQPISMNSASRERPRRESLAGSMVTGMSWGGTSVGSWIRDEYDDLMTEEFGCDHLLIKDSIIMQGSSPFGTYQSPSFHSSSYLPKLEATFMKDFTCCGNTLGSLHELLQHYEENHSAPVGLTMSKQPSNSGRNTPPDPKAALAAGAANAIKDPSKAQQPPGPSRVQVNRGTATPQQRTSPPAQQRTSQPAQNTVRGFAPAPPAQPPISQDDDAVGNMEIDDDTTVPPEIPQLPYQNPNAATMMQNYQVGQQNQRPVPPLDLNGANFGPQFQQYRGLRQSTPTTPVSARTPGQFYQNNPTVSSVNTPTLTTNPATTHLQQQFYTPDSSAPGTPSELDGDLMGNMSAMNMGNSGFPPNQQFSNFGYGNGNEMLDLCIDEPAKRLFTANGGFSTPVSPSQSQAQPVQQQRPPTSSAVQLGDGQYSENSELARTIREQQKLAGVPDPSADGIPKPFHCPVIGCEKAYKNQNGLKYHKSVSRPLPHWQDYAKQVTKLTYARFTARTQYADTVSKS